MSEKTKIGASTGDLQRADTAERIATDAVDKLTVIHRRIRTFYDALTYVQFPTVAPAWAPNWQEWLLTGEITKAAPTLATEDLLPREEATEPDAAVDFERDAEPELAGQVEETLIDDPEPDPVVA